MPTYFVTKTKTECFLVNAKNKDEAENSLSSNDKKIRKIRDNCSINVETSGKITLTNYDEQSQRQRKLTSLVEPVIAKLKADKTREYELTWLLIDGVNCNCGFPQILREHLLPRYVSITPGKWTTKSGYRRCGTYMYAYTELPTGVGAAGIYYDLDSDQKYTVKAGQVVKTSTYSI